VQVARGIGQFLKRCVQVEIGAGGFDDVTDPDRGITDDDRAGAAPPTPSMWRMSDALERRSGSSALTCSTYQSIS